MESNSNKNSPDTLENVWAVLREIAERQKNADIQMEKSRVEAEKRIAEFDARLEKSRAKFDAEMEKSHAEFNKEMKVSRAEFDARLKASEDSFYAELRASTAEHNRRMKNLDKTIGGMGNSHGFFAEEYFFNSFEDKNQTFFGETFDDILKNVPAVEDGINDEYDIVMRNGSAAGIVEVKYKARLEDIPRIINKANTFRTNYPKYANHRIYLALAAMIFDKPIEDECIKQGIAIVKQVGETVIIKDENLKVF